LAINNKIRLNFVAFFITIMITALNAADLKDVQKRINQSLRHDILETWYPLCVDTKEGGFLSSFSSDWQPENSQDKFLVNQTRHIWTLSAAAFFYKDTIYRNMADQGFQFLKNCMRDSVYGGFYMLRSRSGEPVNYAYRDEKRAYGLAFAIYALSAYYQISKENEALKLAVETFQWLEKHSYDTDFGGYMEHLTRTGDWLEPSVTNSTAWDCRSSGWKDQNSSIHLLEAFTALYKIWPDSLLRQRLTEMFVLIRDKITNHQGSLILFFQRNWEPVSYQDSTETIRSANYFYDHISFGHNLETAYLLIEAMHVLNHPTREKTMNIAKKMVDHALTYGWDQTYGGFYDAGYALKNFDTVTIINKEKTWWVQAEGLNALLLMHKLFPGQSVYLQTFLNQWQYIDQYLIDHKYGGWYWAGLDRSPEQIEAPKAVQWKINYHNTRAMINCLHMLKDISFSE